MDAQAPPPDKLCSRCCRLLPVSEFRRVRATSDSPLRSECRACRNAVDRERRTAARYRRLSHDLTQLGGCRTFERIEAIFRVMLTAFGGPEGLARELAAMVRDLPETSSARRRVHMAILNSLVVLEKHRILQEQRRLRSWPDLETLPADLSELSDEGLLDAACQPLRRLHSSGALATALRHLIRRGELEPSILSCVDLTA